MPPTKPAASLLPAMTPLDASAPFEAGAPAHESTVESAVPQAALGEDAPPDPAEIVPRLQGAVARVLPAIEATLAKLAAGPMQPREMERAARTLTSLTRTLRELNGLLSQHQTPGAAQHDDWPEDIDAFRIEFARRINAFVDSRTGGNADRTPPKAERE